MVAIKYAVITTGLSACAGAVVSGLYFLLHLMYRVEAADPRCAHTVVHKRPNAKAWGPRASASAIADISRLTKFGTPSAAPPETPNNILQRPLGRGIYWSASTASGSKLSARAFVMPPNANVVASATALAVPAISLAIDLVNSALSLALALGSSVLSSSTPGAPSSSSSISPAAKSVVSPPNNLVTASTPASTPASASAIVTALERPSAASDITLLGSAMGYAMGIMGSALACANSLEAVAFACATSHANSARSCAVALRASALSSANAIVDSALTSVSALKSSALATATAATLDEATLSSATAIPSSALSAATVLIASAPSAPPPPESQRPVRTCACVCATPTRSAPHTPATSFSVLVQVAASVDAFVGAAIARFNSAIRLWARGGELATPVAAPTPTRTVYLSKPVPT